VTTFAYTFYGCTSLTSIPVDLFRYNIGVTSFTNTFSNCPKLTLRSDIFGIDYANRFLNKSVDFTDALRSVGTLAGSAGVAPALWLYNFGSGTPTKTSCFLGASLSTATNYADIPVEWR
jgi:hypothetical protein